MSDRTDLQGIEMAWHAVEDAKPDEWYGPCIDVSMDGWVAELIPGDPDDPTADVIEGRGETPTAALLDLAEKTRKAFPA